MDIELFVKNIIMLNLRRNAKFEIIM